MTQIEILKAFLQDAIIQEKYGLTAEEVDRITWQTQPNAQAKILVDLLKRMIQETEDKSKNFGVVASTMNAVLNNSFN